MTTLEITPVEMARVVWLKILDVCNANAVLDVSGLGDVAELCDSFNLGSFFDVNAWSRATDPLKILMSRGIPDPVIRALSVYCQNVYRVQPPTRDGLATP